LTFPPRAISSRTFAASGAAIIRRVVTIARLGVGVETSIKEFKELIGCAERVPF
jgi:hypothetical protein